MNVKRSVLVVGACLCVAALTLVMYRAGASSVNLKPNSQWMADGGAPMPPWPPKPQLVADGGAPMPPWPPKPQLVADGGAPMPPWPKAPATNQQG
jgi:hypothetical protein